MAGARGGSIAAMIPAGATVVQEDCGGAGEKFKVGKAYVVKLTTGVEFRGIVLGYDSAYNLVVFQDGTMLKPGHSMTTRVVNANFITELRFMGKFKDPLASKKRSADLYELRAKEALAIRKIEKIGVGVTAEAQSIFDALSKTLPVQWENKEILVMRQVRICSPYHSDCVIGGSTTANSRVKKVLMLEREKLKLSGT